MKQKVLMIIALIIFLGIGLLCGNEIGKNRNSLATLPKPELSEGQRGELGIDKNINEENIDAYLGRSDSVYYDMRMLIDPANYSAIGGDSYLSGYVRGFEVIPYPLLTNVEGLPEAVGKSYSGDTLFTNKNGKFTANYKESKQIIQDLFPKDKIYVVGGYWYYSGKNNVEVKQKNDDGKDYYAFWKIPYHDLDFSKLTKN